jgi:chromosome segregation ATPase
MATNGIEMAADHGQATGVVRKRALENRAPENDYRRAAAAADPVEPAEDFALAPLVDKIAYTIARGLSVAVKELEQHIAAETGKVAEAVDRRYDSLQTSLQDLANFVVEQRTTNGAVQGQLQQLNEGLRESDARRASDVEALRNEARESSAAVSQRIDATAASQREADARRAAEVEALRSESRATEARQAADLASLKQSISERIDGLCKEVGVQQEDIVALKATLGTFCSRVDALVERLDRQAEVVRSMCTAYSQRETELEQVVTGLARLRSYPAPLPANGL